MSELGHFITDKTPYGWNTQPLWSLFRRRKKTGFSNEELLSVYRDHGVIPKSSRDDNHNKESDDLSGYQLVSEGSLVTNKMKAWQGSIAISRYRGIVSPAYYVYEPLSAECDQFLHYLLRSELYISLYGRISKGVRVNQWDLEHAALRAVPVALPDLPTQKAIADFLDRETARIDQLIEKKQRIVEVLGEKRQAVISRAVTRGLDADVPMKDSGVEWLGNIPAHWEVKQLRRAIMFQRGHDLPADEREEGDVAIVSSSGISSTHSRAAAKAPGIVTGRYGTIGQFHLIYQDYWPLNTTLYSIDLCGNEPRFLLYMLVHMSPLFLAHAVKSAVPGVNRNDVHADATVVPPISDQRAIAACLDEETANIDSLVTKVRQTNGRLREFRSALITAAVTGQIDVSTWGKQGTTDRRLDRIEEASSP